MGADHSLDEDAVVTVALPATGTLPREHSALRANVDRYLVIDEVGRGGMGVVLRAYDPKLQREVALKTVRSEALSAEAHEQMLREAQAMAKLSHPNVVGVYDVVIIGEEVVLAMEFVQGTTLQRWLEQKHSWREVLGMFIEAGRGLSAAHAAGLLHRDFKPANVLVGLDGRARVTDFGLAREHTEGSAPSSPGSMSTPGSTDPMSFGTPRDMAPELHEGRMPAVDQYAFCVALWEGLAGRIPAVPRADATGVISSKPRWWWRRERNALCTLVEALRRGLSPDPADRWPTLDALLVELERARKNRHRAAAGRFAAASLILMVGGLTWSGVQQRLTERCTGAQAQLVGVWDPERRASVQHAMRATGVSYAEDTWRRVAPQLDGYASAWAAMHTDTCAATSVRGEQPAAVMDLRMACLHRARVELRAVADLLARADAQVVEKAYDVATSLPDITRCSDLDALQAEVAPPSATNADRVEAIRTELAEVKALRVAGKYPEALSTVMSLSERAQTIDYEPLALEVMLELAFAREAAGDYDEAEVVFRKALRSALMGKRWEDAQRVAARLVSSVGGTLAKPREGLAYAEVAKALLALGADDSEARLRNAMGNLWQQLGRYDEAERELRAAVALATVLHGPSHRETADFRANLAWVLKARGSLEDAEAEFRASLDVLRDVIGPEHPESLFTRYNLANLLRVQGRFAEAEAEYRAVLASQATSLGPDHLKTSLTRASLAHVLIARGDALQAEGEYRAALEVQTRVLGAEHFITTGTQNALASVLGYLGRYAEAERHFRESLAADEKNVGADHPDVASTRARFGELLIRQGRHVEAELETRAALRSLERAGMQRSLPLAHNSLAAALRGQGRHAEAETQSRTALSFAQQTIGDDHPSIAPIRIGLAIALESQGRLRDAEDELRTALALQLKVVGPKSTQIAATRGRLGSTLRAQRRFEEAEAQYREALALDQTAATAEGERPDAAFLQSGLAWTLLESGRALEALPIFERAWTTWKADARIDVSTRSQLAFGFARALWNTRHDRARARALAREASELLASRTDDRERREVETWLRSHGGGRPGS